MFVLKERKYTWLDMYKIPFSCDPVSTIAVTIQKAITALVNVFQVVVVAEFLDKMVQAVVNQSFNKEVIVWFVLMLLIVSWKRISYNIGRIFTKHFVIRGNKQVLCECTEKRDRLSYYLLEDPETEELTNRVLNNVENNLNEMLQRFLNFFVVYIPRIVGVLFIIALHVWWLAIVVMVMTIPLIFISMRGGQKIYHANKEAAIYERRHKYLFDVLTGRETVEERSLFGYTKKVNEQWHNQYETARKINIKATAIFAANMQGGSMVTSILASIICLIMVPLAVSGALSLGLFVSLSTAIYDLVNLMGWEMTRAVSQIAKFKEYMRDLTKFAALPERKETSGDIAQKVPEFEQLEFRNVTFHYPGSDVDILKGFSMVLKKGAHYAVVGENGAGKSTLIKLLTGLYRDYEGEILYNGMEMRSFKEQDWFQIFSCTFQDFARYYLSVEENIGIGSRNMEGANKKEDMQEILKKLGIHKEIAALKYGYKTRLGKLDKDSVDLSGGQWQRLVMGRALMNDAPILLLDEPTAALDPISESELYEKFGEISRGRTTIFISHRLGSIKLADHIYVLKNGCVAEQGTHRELLEKQGVYAVMYETQQSWYTKEGEGETGGKESN